MIKIPLFVIFAIIAFNITAFTVVLQMDLLEFHSSIAKLVAWILAAGAWGLAYANRHKSYILRTDK